MVVNEGQQRSNDEPTKVNDIQRRSTKVNERSTARVEVTLRTVLDSVYVLAPEQMISMIQEAG